MIDIQEISELDIPRYAPIFGCIYDLFQDYVGVYFKLVIDGEEKILQRRDDLFVIYTMSDDRQVGYEMFTVDEEYKVNSAGFDNFELHTVDGTRVIQDRNCNNLESLIFSKRSDGADNDGYDGIIGYVQYNQEKDVRLMIMYQQMFNRQDKIYSFHVKNPFQILIEERVAAKNRGSILPIKTTHYVRGEYDYRDNPTLYNIATIKDYGLSEFIEKGSFALQKSDSLVRYYKVLFTTQDKQAVTGFPFCRQYRFEDFQDFFDKYGFKSEIPEHLISIYNGENSELNYYQDIANFMKEIEMTPPDEVVKLNLKFEGNGEDGTNS